MKGFDVALRGPGGEFGLSWRGPSRLESPGRSLDLEETSYESGSGSGLTLDRDDKYGTVS